MKQFLDLVKHIKENGNFKSDRTGTGTFSVFGYQMRFDLSKGFPLVTAKHTHLKSIIHELLWFLKGETNIRYLKENGVRIWDEWCLKGTEEYRPMTVEEMKEAIIKADQKATNDGRSEYHFSMLENDSEVVCSKDYNSDTGITNIEYRQKDGLEQLYLELHEEQEPKVLIGGELGPVYGSQWRSWPSVKFTETELSKASGGVQGGSDVEFGTIDQIKNLINTLKSNPDSRRAIVTAWNPAEVDNMALPPCHALFQFYSNFMSMNELENVIRESGKNGDYLRALKETTMMSDDEFYDNALLFCQTHDLPRRKLSCQLYQRSADVFLGVPFNIASYALLTMMVAQVTNHTLGEFIWTGGDCHLYANHTEQVDILLSRKTYPLPTMKINPEVKDIFNFKFSDFELLNYVSGPVLSAPIAV